MGNDDKLFKQIVTDLAVIIKDHENRIRWLERQAFMLLGVIVFVSFLLKP